MQHTLRAEPPTALQGNLMMLRMTMTVNMEEKAKKLPSLSENNIYCLFFSVMCDIYIVCVCVSALLCYDPKKSKIFEDRSGSPNSDEQNEQRDKWEHCTPQQQRSDLS